MSKASFTPGPWTAWAHANARLIAASPDMYEALKSCPLPSTMGSRDDHYQRFYDWYNKHVTAALSKAEAGHD